ncbi:hypothetical protein Ate02nite_11500 [Paractinoplanes tereljensis]|uniref:Uncharacterized protein n=1 Tax=Paractinoplanes tereljensis TaxID=571912 RepID=A0A919NHW7_9ACTN|nr:hypothetical protein Ate02nite_11500 [Actinoplanes tereljensis]
MQVVASVAILRINCVINFLFRRAGEFPGGHLAAAGARPGVAPRENCSDGTLPGAYLSAVCG